MKSYFSIKNKILDFIIILLLSTFLNLAKFSIYYFHNFLYYILF